MANLPIDGDTAQMQNTRRGKVYIQAVVHIAHEPAEHPLAVGELHRRIKCHRTQRHQHVCHGQRDDEIIRDNAARKRK